MHPELQNLLALQDDDEAVRAIEAEMASLNPRIQSLDKARQRAHEEGAKAAAALQRETERLRGSTTAAPRSGPAVVVCHWMLEVAQTHFDLLDQRLERLL